MSLLSEKAKEQLEEIKEAKRNYMAKISYRIEVVKSFEKLIYQEQLRERQDKLNDLLLRNSQILGCSPTFVYDGKWYHTPNHQKVRGDNKRIAPQLYREVREFFVKKDRELALEQDKVINYVRQAISAAKHYEDLHKLIPGKLKSHIRQVQPSYFSIAEPMTNEDAEQFKIKHNEGLSAINRLFLTQLLLSK